jgi:uncharacterized membrane protein YwaF
MPNEQFGEQFKEQLWGQFGIVHFTLLAFAVIITVALYFALRNSSKRTQILTLFGLSLMGTFAVIYNMLNTNTVEALLRRLPLEWWSIAVVLLPLAILSRSNRLSNFILLWSLGSLWRLVFNADITGPEFFTVPNMVAYFTDTLCAGISILSFELGIVKRDPKSIKRTMGVSVVVYSMVYLANSAIHHFAGVKVNYMASVQPTNELLGFLYQLIPYQYFYGLLVFPLVLIYMFWWYLPEILEQRRENKTLRAKLKTINKYYREYKKEYIDEILEEKKY